MHDISPPGLLSSVFSSGIPDCNPTVSPRLYHICMAPVSVSTCQVLHGELSAPTSYLLSPARVVPVYSQIAGNRGLVAAVFGILFSSLCVLVLDRDPLPLIAHSSQKYWKILALLYYPAFYYPLIACATVRHRVSYLVGCLLSWCHCVVHIWQKVDCPQSPKIYRYYSTLSYIPIILCLVLLSLWYPALLIRSFTGQEETLDKEVMKIHGVTQGMVAWENPSMDLHAFRSSPALSTKIEENLLSRVQTYLRSYIYVPEEGKLRAGTGCVALLLLVAVVPTIQIVRAGMTKDIVILLVQFGLVPSESPAVPGDMEKELNTVKYYLWSLEGGFLARSCPRREISNPEDGAVLDVFYKAHILRPSRQAIVCWMSFAAFQTAFACLGLLIQQVIFFICSVGFTFLFIIPLQSGTNTYLFKIIQNMWPFWLTLVVAVIVQNLAAHYQFLEQHPLRKELTNRRALYIVTYLLFPINVLVGVLAGVWRMVISGLYNAVHFSQLDISLLNRSVENFDPGYHAYCHYLKIEVSQSHPVMKAFCLLLLQLAKPEGPPGLQASNVEEGIQLMQPKKAPPSRARFKQSRARWWLAYTLLKNPSLTACRKTALSDPTANGTQLSPPKP
uniref:Receptor for retinol uptake STRA6 n=1 Tax=Aquila chrysaetos chrysaetos TaxID=223781 RepID=A0A663DYC4_AQUCH